MVHQKIKCASFPFLSILPKIQIVVHILSTAIFSIASLFLASKCEDTVVAELMFLLRISFSMGFINEDLTSRALTICTECMVAQTNMHCSEKIGHKNEIVEVHRSI